ncbi:hypothetical protein PQX77_001218 [Marasmius sp. AFHP31]|nr:hypothetical protein PQX77_001218 [Marasmius sp. AFHP31]
MLSAKAVGADVDETGDSEHTELCPLGLLSTLSPQTPPLSTFTTLYPHLTMWNWLFRLLGFKESDNQRALVRQPDGSDSSSDSNPNPNPNTPNQGNINVPAQNWQGHAPQNYQAGAGYQSNNTGTGPQHNYQGQSWHNTGNGVQNNNTGSGSQNNNNGSGTQHNYGGQGYTFNR